MQKTEAILKPKSSAKNLSKSFKNIAAKLPNAMV